MGHYEAYITPHQIGMTYQSTIVPNVTVQLSVSSNFYMFDQGEGLHLTCLIVGIVSTI